MTSYFTGRITGSMAGSRGDSTQMADDNHDNKAYGAEVSLSGARANQSPPTAANVLDQFKRPGSTNQSTAGSQSGQDFARKVFGNDQDIQRMEDADNAVKSILNPENHVIIRVPWEIRGKPTAMDGADNKANRQYQLSGEKLLDKLNRDPNAIALQTVRTRNGDKVIPFNADTPFMIKEVRHIDSGSPNLPYGVAVAIKGVNGKVALESKTLQNDPVHVIRKGNNTTPQTVYSYPDHQLGLADRWAGVAQRMNSTGASARSSHNNTSVWNSLKTEVQQITDPNDPEKAIGFSINLSKHNTPGHDYTSHVHRHSSKKPYADIISRNDSEMADVRNLVNQRVTLNPIQAEQAQGRTVFTPEEFHDEMRALANNVHEKIHTMKIGDGITYEGQRVDGYKFSEANNLLAGDSDLSRERLMHGTDELVLVFPGIAGNR